MKMNYNFLKSNKGQSMLIFVLTVTVLMGFSALAIDIGLVSSDKSKLQNAVDSAAPAGAQELPADKEKAVVFSEEYLQKNGIDPTTAEIAVSDDGFRCAIHIERRRR